MTTIAEPGLPGSRLRTAAPAHAATRSHVGTCPASARSREWSPHERQDDLAPDTGRNHDDRYQREEILRWETCENS
jgi:hypothetical protein